MTPLELAMALDPAILMETLGLPPDPWQAKFLRSKAQRMLLLCSRQAGKSTSTAVLALHTARFQPGSLVLLLSPSLRQSGELFRKVVGFYKKLGGSVGSQQESATTLHLENDSRVVSLPASPDTIRGYSGVRLLIVDEAAMAPDQLFVAVSPMLAVSGGRQVLLSSPLGKRGFFYEAWENPMVPWERVKITAHDCPRISKEFLEEERRSMGDRWFRQEYEASFEDTVDQVFSNESILAAFDTDTPPLWS